MPAAASQPPAMSIGIHVAASGSLPAPPAARSKPVTACMSASFPGKAAQRPVAPKALAWQYTASGFRRATVPASMPRRSATPTRKLCSTTSARLSSCSTTGRASGAPMFSARLRLPRWHAATAYAAARMASPSGGSTLTTSAPRSARISAASGPATNAEKSTTRRPASRRAWGKHRGSFRLNDLLTSSGSTDIGEPTMTSRSRRMARPVSARWGSASSSPGASRGSHATPASRSRAIHSSRGRAAKNDTHRAARSPSLPVIWSL